MSTVPETFNFADLWEGVMETVADREALVCGVDRRTYAELEEHANRLAHWMRDQGVRPGAYVGLYLTNSVEWVEAFLACMKIRAVPINVNYRYVAEELAYLFADAGVVGILVDRGFAGRLAEVVGDLPALEWAVVVDDGSDADVETLAATDLPVAGYADALAAGSPDRGFGARSNDDLYVIYTGGTTGLPKGVVWRQEDAFHACIGGGDPMRMLGAIDEPAQILDRIVPGFVFHPVAPLMHAAGAWTVTSWLLCGGKNVLLEGSLDPVGVWRTIEREGVNTISVVGDAVLKPLLDAWDTDGPFDVSTLLAIGSGGAPLTPSTRARALEILPTVSISDGYGSSETGAQTARKFTVDGGPETFSEFGADHTTAVIDPAARAIVAPGSETVGRVARRGHIPLRYHNDPVKTDETFVEIEGERWILTGDQATVAADGSIALLGRGSACINTGGEKVYPEEVEAVIAGHPSVYDAVVVGAPDERWGERVTALVQLRHGTTLTLDELDDFCRPHLAGYKLPRSLVVVGTVVRSPAGKPDHRWAKAVAADAGAPST
jgi:acyl-CoA synthetase (AMP-forming)/AMP-acid ligase II